MFRFSLESGRNADEESERSVLSSLGAIRPCWYDDDAGSRRLSRYHIGRHIRCGAGEPSWWDGMLLAAEPEVDEDGSSPLTLVGYEDVAALDI